MLGLSEKKRRLQELPFGKEDVSTRFVTLVIIMMTALATLALGGAEMIMSMRGTWVDAIRGQVSIELPAMNEAGFARTPAQLEALSARVADAVREDGGDAVREVHHLGREDVAALVQPWLGDASGTDDLPLPALIGVTYDATPDADALARLRQAVQDVDAQATIETHQSWIQDLRRFAGVLLAASGFMAFAVILCAMLCVTGAVKAQLAAHKADIDLLHLMGAHDQYIGAQFVRVVARDVGRAALIGTALGICLLKLGGYITDGMQATGVSGFEWTGLVWLSFMILPVVITGICFFAARDTVLRELQKMP